MIPPRIEKILDLARWAPSGDNTQPWRFEILDESNFVIHGSDTRDWCVYDLDGRASQIAIGALLENIFIAASDQGLRVEFSRREEAAETNPTIAVELTEDASIIRDPLIDFIEQRVTQRRPLSTTALTIEQKKQLEESVGPGYSVSWVEGAANRWQMARLLSRSAKIRLTIPEAYEVHKRIIEWDAQFSEDKIPDKAVGLDPLGLKLMRWAMVSWKRVDLLNRYLAGTWLPRLQLDLLPGFFCAAHFLISSHEQLETVDDYLNGGRAMQRFWLTTAELGLQFQPEMTPLIFSRFVDQKTPFTLQANASRAASQLASELSHTFEKRLATAGIFLGRVGNGKTPASRSTRLSINKLTSPAQRS